MLMKVQELTPAFYRTLTGAVRPAADAREYVVVTVQYARVIRFPDGRGGTARVVIIVPQEFPALEIKMKNTEQRSSLRLLMAAGILPPAEKGNDVLPWSGARLALQIRTVKYFKTATEKFVAVHPDDHPRVSASWEGTRYGIGPQHEHEGAISNGTDGGGEAAGA